MRRRLLSLVGLAAGLGFGGAQAQTDEAPGRTAPNPTIGAFTTICLAARAGPAASAKAALAAHWSPIPEIAIPAMGGAAFQDPIGFRAPDPQAPSRQAPAYGAAAQGVWVIIGRTPMPGFSYLADSCAVFAAPADTDLSGAVRAWAGGAPSVDDPGQQLVQYTFAEPGGDQPTRKLLTGSIEASTPGLQVGTISLVTVVPGAKRSVLVYSVVNP
jgi:hypothetical protein